MAAANILVNGARAIESNLITGLGGTAPNYLSIGSGSTTAAAADTSLTNEYTTGTWTGYARVHVTTPTRTTTTLTNDTLNWSGSFTAGAAQSVFEAALYDSSTLGGGNLFIHSSFASAVGLANGDSITCNFSLQLL